jgi:hypothetical protein
MERASAVLSRQREQSKDVRRVHQSVIARLPQVLKIPQNVSGNKLPESELYFLAFLSSTTRFSETFIDDSIGADLFTHLAILRILIFAL